MAVCVYPALFHPNAADGTITIRYPDLPGCGGRGISLEDALDRAREALSRRASEVASGGGTLPPATAIQDVAAEPGEFVSLIRAAVRDKRRVRRTVSIPRWMDEEAKARNISLSRILCFTLGERFSQ